MKCKMLAVFAVAVAIERFGHWQGVPMWVCLVMTTPAYLAGLCTNFKYKV